MLNLRSHIKAHDPNHRLNQPTDGETKNRLSILEPFTYCGHKLEAVDSVKNMLSGSCLICLDAYFGKSVFQLACGHILDNDCYIQNKEKNGGKCPAKCEQDSSLDRKIGCLESRLNASNFGCTNDGCYFTSLLMYVDSGGRGSTCPYPDRSPELWSLDCPDFLFENQLQVMRFVKHCLEGLGVKLAGYKLDPVGPDDFSGEDTLCKISCECKTEARGDDFSFIIDSKAIRSPCESLGQCLSELYTMVLQSIAFSKMLDKYPNYFSHQSDVYFKKRLEKGEIPVVSFGNEKSISVDTIFCSDRIVNIDGLRKQLSKQNIDYDKLASDIPRNTYSRGSFSIDFNVVGISAPYFFSSGNNGSHDGQAPDFVDSELSDDQAEHVGTPDGSSSSWQLPEQERAV